jgi:hypothetical protein
VLAGRRSAPRPLTRARAQASEFLLKFMRVVDIDRSLLRTIHMQGQRASPPPSPPPPRSLAPLRPRAADQAFSAVALQLETARYGGHAHQHHPHQQQQQQQQQSAAYSAHYVDASELGAHPVSALASARPRARPR